MLVSAECHRSPSSATRMSGTHGSQRHRSFMYWLTLGKCLFGPPSPQQILPQNLNLIVVIAQRGHDAQSQGSYDHNFALTLPNVFKHDIIDISIERSQPGLPRTFPDAPGSGFTRIARAFSSKCIFEKAGDRLADFFVPRE
jgi:hypothetical protein